MLLKPYACTPEKTRGRIHKELPTPYRNEFERDRDRIIHSNAFKRLQYKTQVFVNHEGDHYRNRLTHSIEVSTVARSLARELGLCEELAEAVSLAHDLGHSPFGHAGEAILNECMADSGGFSHNGHSFKILTSLEHKYADYDGLNLTLEVLEGIVKHNGPLVGAMVPPQVLEYDRAHSLDLGRYTSAEAQVASLSDDIAYICHDFEDGIRAGILQIKDIEELKEIKAMMRHVQQQHAGISTNRLIHEVVRKLMHYLIKGLLDQTRKNIKKYHIETEEDIRGLDKALVEFTPEVRDQVKIIKNFMMEKVYRHHKVMSVNYQCQIVVRELFKLYLSNTELLPQEWQKVIRDVDIHVKKSIIADYIAGMTDRFAIKQYQSFFNLNLMDI